MSRARDMRARLALMEAARLEFWRDLPAGFDEQDHADAMEEYDEQHGRWIEAARAELAEGGK